MVTWKKKETESLRKKQKFKNLEVKHREVKGAKKKKSKSGL